VLDIPTSDEETILFASIRQAAGRPARVVLRDRREVRGVTEETTAGVHRLYQMVKEGPPALPGHQRERPR
jgi:adenosylhomocysteinase